MAPYVACVAGALIGDGIVGLLGARPGGGLILAGIALALWVFR